MIYEQEVLVTGDDRIPAVESGVESRHFENEPGTLVRRPRRQQRYSRSCLRDVKE